MPSPSMATIARDTAESVRLKANRALREEAARQLESVGISLEGGLWREAAQHGRLMASALEALAENERSRP